jgi:hypothetical protein
MRTSSRLPRRLPRLLRRAVQALPLLFALAVAAPAFAAPPPPLPQLTEKPSGFWTSTRPAKGGSYRYRMLGIGVALAAITGLFTVRIIRRHGARTPRM